MAYTQYAHDLFLSYRHLDNKPFTGEKEGWIACLHRDLSIRVAQYLGEDVEVWRDPRLQGNEYFSDTIEQTLSEVAAMVSVISPGYEKSDWCRRELNGFVSSAESRGGIKIGNYARLFKLLKTPTPLSDQPIALQSLLGYEFFFESREFHLDPDPIAEKRYLAKVDDVARDIHQLLKAMKGPPSNPEKKAPVDSVTAVYLAWTTSDRADDRDSIRRELVDRNFDVFPKSDPPLDNRSLASVVENALDRCDYS